MTRILKSRDSDLDRIEALAAPQEKMLVKDFIARVNQLKSEDKIEQIRVFLEQGRYDLALEVLQEDDSDFLLIVFGLWFAASKLQLSMTKESMETIQRQLFGTVKPIIFDPTSETNAANLRILISKFKDDWNASKANSFWTIVNDGVANGLSAEDIALRIGRFQGLSQAQIKAVLNYERLLREGSKEALSYALRNPTLDGRILAGKQLTENQIQMLVNSYIRNQLTYRAGVVARTIAGDVINTAMEETQKQAMLDAGLDPNDLLKEWRSLRDSRVRRTHKQHIGLDGQVVGIDEYYISPSGARLKHPHDGNAPISETANCRCRQLVYLRKDKVQ